MISLLIRYKVIISILVFSIMYLYTLDDYWKPVWDSAIYISLAKSIAAGNGYHYMGLPHAKYPFIFPLILSPIIGLFGLNFLLMRLLIIVLTIGSLYLTYILFRKSTDEGMALAIMLLTGFSSTLLHLSTWILSDVPYMFFSLCTLYFLIDYSKDNSSLTKTGFLSSIFLLMAIFTRMIGITLFIAFLCHFLLLFSPPHKRQGSLFNGVKKVILVSLIISLPLCLWFYRSYLINKNTPFKPEYRGILSYEKEFFLKVPDNIHSESLSLRDFLKRIQGNFRIYAKGISTIICKSVHSTKFRLFTLLLFLCGFCWCFLKRRSVIEYYFIFYLTFCIIWWFNQHPPRFLAPVIPFIFYYLLIGLKMSLELLCKMVIKVEKNRAEMGKRVIRGLVVFLLILTNFSFKPSVIKSERRSQFHPQALIGEFFSAIEWIKENTLQDSIIMSNRAPWVIMFTDRKTLTWPLFEPLSYVVNSIVKNHVGYIVVSTIHQETYHLLHNFVENHPKQFIQVFRNNKTSIYKVERENFPNISPQRTPRPQR